MERFLWMEAYKQTKRGKLRIVHSEDLPQFFIKTLGMCFLIPFSAFVFISCLISLLRIIGAWTLAKVAKHKVLHNLSEQFDAAVAQGNESKIVALGNIFQDELKMCLTKASATKLVKELGATLWPSLFGFPTIFVG